MHIPQISDRIFKCDSLVPITLLRMVDNTWRNNRMTELEKGLCTFSSSAAVAKSEADKDLIASACQRKARFNT